MRTGLIGRLLLDQFIASFKLPKKLILDFRPMTRYTVQDGRFFSRLGDLANRELMEIAFFDTFPTSDATAFSGAWSVYPYLPSGIIIVSDVTNGLFILSLP